MYMSDRCFRSLHLANQGKGLEQCISCYSVFPTLLYSHIGLNTMTTLRLMNVYLGLVVRKPVNANPRLKVNQLSLLIY